MDVTAASSRFQAPLNLCAPAPPNGTGAFSPQMSTGAT